MKLFVEACASKYCKSKLQRSFTIYRVAPQEFNKTNAACVLLLEFKWHSVIADHFDLQVEVHL